MDRSCRLLHGQSRQLFEWNYFPLLTRSIVLSNKQRSLREYLSIFQKQKKLFGKPCTMCVYKWECVCVCSCETNFIFLSHYFVPIKEVFFFSFLLNFNFLLQTELSSSTSLYESRREVYAKVWVAKTMLQLKVKRKLLQLQWQ